MWARVEDGLPEENEIVLCYRESPDDAEAMVFRAGAFIDAHGMDWKVGVVTHWKRTTKPN